MIACEADPAKLRRNPIAPESNDRCDGPRHWQRTGRLDNAAGATSLRQFDRPRILEPKPFIAVGNHQLAESVGVINQGTRTGFFD